MQKSLKYFMEIRRKPGWAGPWKRSLMNMPLAAKEMSRLAWLRRRLNSRDLPTKESPRDARQDKAVLLMFRQGRGSI
jgi:hypothetical protein